MKNRRQILLLFLLGLVVLLTAILVATYHSGGIRERLRLIPPSEIQLRNEAITRRLGQAYTEMEKGHFAESEKILKRILRKRPGNSMTMQLLGQLYYRSERFSDAEKIYRIMLRNNEFDAAALNNLGQVLSRLGRHEEALSYLLRSREINPQNMTVCINLSVVYSALNQPEKAREMFLEAHRKLQQKQQAAASGNPAAGRLPNGEKP